MQSKSIKNMLLVIASSALTTVSCSQDSHSSATVKESPSAFEQGFAQEGLEPGLNPQKLEKFTCPSGIVFRRVDPNKFYDSSDPHKFDSLRNYLCPVIDPPSSYKNIGVEVEFNVEDKSYDLTCSGIWSDSISFDDLRKGKACEFMRTCKNPDLLNPEAQKTVAAMKKIANSDDCATAWRNLSAMEEFDLSGQGIQDLTPILNFKNATTLILNDNKIRDLKKLATMTQLKRLQLNNNQITDLSPLTALTHLPELAVGGNQFTDIAPITSLTSLTVLILSKNNLGNLKNLDALTNLTALDLAETHLGDIKEIASLTNLTFLRLSHNQITDISYLSSLTNLRTLWLDDNKITSIESLSSLNFLSMLDVKFNQIADLCPLFVTHSTTSVASHLHIFDVDGNPAHDNTGASCPK